MISYEAGLVPTMLSALTLGTNSTSATAYGHSNFVLDYLSSVDIVVVVLAVAIRQLIGQSSCFACSITLGPNCRTPILTLFVVCLHGGGGRYLTDMAWMLQKQALGTGQGGSGYPSPT